MPPEKIDWKNHLIELTVVFMGISAAFMLNNWRESYLDNQQEQNYLRSFADDLSADLTSLDSLIEVGQTALKEVCHLQSMLENGRIRNDSLLFVVGMMGRINSHSARTSTFETIKSGGNFNLISDYRLKENLVEYYQMNEEIKMLDQLFYDYMNDYYIPFIFKNLDFTNQKIIHRKEFTGHFFRNVVQAYAVLIRQGIGFYEELREMNRKLADQLEQKID